jgi:hypothetical protein
LAPVGTIEAGWQPVEGPNPQQSLVTLVADLFGAVLSPDPVRMNDEVLLYDSVAVPLDVQGREHHRVVRYPFEIGFESDAFLV